MKPMLAVLLGGVVAVGCAQPGEDAREPSPPVSSNKYAWTWWRDQAVAKQARDAMVQPSLAREMPQEPIRLARDVAIEVLGRPASPGPAAQPGITDLSGDLESVMQILERLVEQSFAVQRALLRMQLRESDGSKPQKDEEA